MYKVTDLHQAVAKLNDAGFNVEYGQPPKKAYNAMIWLEDNVFIEIFQSKALPRVVKFLMMLIGYKAILQRMEKWNQVENGWCEWSIESGSSNLKEEKDIFQLNRKDFISHLGKRTNVFGQKLSWHLIFPKEICLPFLMSAYSPDPRPIKVDHPNGIRSLDHIVVGENGLDIELLSQLKLNWKKIKISKDASGLKHVILKGTVLRLEDIL